MKFIWKKVHLIGATNKCHHIIVHIVIYKLIDFYVFFLYALCFLYRFCSVSLYISYVSIVSISTISTPTIFMLVKIT